MTGSKMGPFVKKALQTILKHQLIRPGDKILVGVSGGADSIALLHALGQLRSRVGFQVHAAHINHHLRKGADADQRFVEKFCASLNLPCTTKNLELNKRIKQGGSVEEIAREERFKALIMIAKKNNCNALALAHHRDDLAETVLLRILRGTGLQGLQAILPKRMINGSLFIRPLIDANRKEIEGHLKKQNIKFRTDLTNKQTHFFRNKVRRDLLPFLQKEYQNNIQEVLCNLAVTAGEDYEYLRQETLKIFPKLIVKKTSAGSMALDLKKLQALSNAMKRMVLRSAVEHVKGDTLALTLAHLNELGELISKRPTGAIVNLPHGVRAVKMKKSLVIK
ncbi:MAG: tRNA lysidine(34) synthetase TilS [Candidatus Omnitrophica bacterium]|nr:tRNA lysidine(34) synthetase TilS [Candidatus Omnitrophota bacterium]